MTFMEIAKEIKNSEWNKLNLSDPLSLDWNRAIEIFSKRIQERYIEPADKLVDLEKHLPAKEKKYGFVVLAIDCMLIETLQSFYEGKPDTKGQSPRMFVNFLTQREAFCSYFPEDEVLAHRFYDEYRCGILHQSETKFGARVWAVGELLMEFEGDLIINRVAFHDAMKKEFETYLEILKDSSNSLERLNFITKMDFISRKTSDTKRRT